MRAAYKVIEGKGSTNYAIGISGARIAEAFLGGQNAVLPVSTTIAGELYGFKDVAYLTDPEGRTHVASNRREPLVARRNPMVSGRVL